MCPTKSAGFGEPDLQLNGVVVGELKSGIDRVDRNKLDIGGDNKAVDYVILGVLGVFRIERLIEETAARNIEVICHLPALRHDILGDRAGGPEIRVERRILIEAAGEGLVEVASGYDIIALFLFGLNKFTKLLCLGNFAP